MKEDNKESLNTIIKCLDKVLEKHQDKEDIKQLHERIQILKEKRNLD